MSDNESTTPAAAERREFGSLRLRGRIWWLRYRVDGKEKWESLKTTSRSVAERKAIVIADQVGRGDYTPADARRLRFSDLEEMVLTHYRNEGNRSLERAQAALGHLRESLGATRALAITADRVSTYTTERLAAGAARATVNYELAILRKALNIAVERRRLPSHPKISTPNPANARKGFFEADDFEAVVRELPVHLRPVMRFAYYTGWRKQEILNLTWDRVNFATGMVRLETNTTKNAEGREFPFAKLPALAAVLQEQRDVTAQLERDLSREQLSVVKVPFVFHRHGRPIKNYYNAWRAACKRAARGGKRDVLAAIVRPQVLGRIVHDFRRTAVRNLELAGVPRSVAMRLTGIKTESIYRRYAITAPRDLTDGVERLAAFQARGASGGQSPESDSLPTHSAKQA